MAIKRYCKTMKVFLLPLYRNSEEEFLKLWESFFSSKTLRSIFSKQKAHWKLFPPKMVIFSPRIFFCVSHLLWPWAHPLCQSSKAWQNFTGVTPRTKVKCFAFVVVFFTPPLKKLWGGVPRTLRTFFFLKNSEEHFLKTKGTLKFIPTKDGNIFA